MYYIIYGAFYLFSLLPFFIIYHISDGVYALMYYVFGYRKKVVMNNLLIAFPEKTGRERKKIAKQFYHNLADTFMEIIKLLSISDKSFVKRCKGNFEIVNELASKGHSVQLHSGHQFNWEYGSLLMSKMITAVPYYAVYIPIENKAMNRLFLNLRQKYNARFIDATRFKATKEEIFSKPFSIALAADQNPGVPSNAYWQNFFNRPAPFSLGPESGAVKNNTAVVFVRSKKLKRGYYDCVCTVFTENGAATGAGDITRGFRDFLEQVIREEPDNYLWTHKRWKWGYKNEYENKWIDKGAEAPGEGGMLKVGG